jgi:hypothetical protein
MAYVINNNNGESGYSRADFMSALEGKQDVLQSGVNIKTVDGNSVLGQGNIEVVSQTYPHELSELESQLRTKAVSDINHIVNDLIVGSEGNTNNVKKEDLFMFGAISDLHHITDGHSYGPDNSHVVTKAEHSIRLLGSIAFDVGLDTVICCGDLSNGYKNYNPNTDLSGYLRQEYDEIIFPLISGYFNKYILCPYFFVDGNHDRGYKTSDNFSTNKHWLDTVDSINNARGENITVTKIKDIIEDNGIYYPTGGGIGAGTTMTDDGVTGNNTSASYLVEFNTKKVRCAMFSSYESYIAFDANSDINYGNTYPLSIYAATKFSTPTDAKDWMLLAFRHSFQSTAHSNTSIPYSSNQAFLGILGDFMMTGKNQGGNWGSQMSYNWPAPNPDPNGNNIKGRAYAGIITGHQHFHTMSTGGTTCPSIVLSRSFENSATFVDGYPTSEDSYCFSIFIIDIVNWWLYEVQVGRVGGVNDVESLSTGNRERVARKGGTTENMTGLYRYKIHQHR